MEKPIMEKTAIGNITIMKKTTIAKITAKITTTALLFFLALFTLTTNSKSPSSAGQSANRVSLDWVLWFFEMVFQVDSTKSITASETTPYRVTDYSNTYH